MVNWLDGGVARFRPLSGAGIFNRLRNESQLTTYLTERWKMYELPFLIDSTVSGATMCNGPFSLFFIISCKNSIFLWNCLPWSFLDDNFLNKA